MPGGDRTGPAGAGAMTGRGLGLCRGTDKEIPGNIGFGRRNFGCCRGPARGLKRDLGYRSASFTDYDDRYINKEKVLKDQVEFLEQELKVANEQLENLVK